MEFVLTADALFWFKVAGWLFIGGGATYVIGRIWANHEKRDRWAETHKAAEQEHIRTLNKERATLTEEERRKLER